MNREAFLKPFTALVATAAAGLAVGLVAAGVGLGTSPWEILVVAALALLAERQPVRIHSNSEITVTVVPVLFAAVVFGPLAAMVVAAASLVADFGRPYERWIIWTSLRTLAGGLAGLVAVAVIQANEPALASLIVAVLLAALVDAATDGILAATVVALRGGDWRGYLRSIKPALLGTVPLYTPIIVVLALAYDHVSALTALLVFAPAFAAHRFYRLYEEQRQAATALEAANRQLERASLSFATALVATLDARDRYTAGHSAAVAVYARDIAARLGLSDERQQLAHLCGLVHDIGKVGLPAGLLEKQGPLTLDERRIMERHAEIGQGILEKVEDYAEIATVVRHHHERIDGFGYPDGLSGDEIPLLSRIIAVADAYNAMTSDRPYRDAMPSRVARLRLAQAVDSQFDTAVVAAFEAVLAGASPDYRSGQGADFRVESQYASEFLEVRIASAV